VRLTKLEIHGFKSFADHTEMVFEPGVTAIVGPNGCGKSNVSDAVRWVLGEQRARALRGAKMEEVIFQGSSARRAVNLAEVSLHFENDDGALDIPFREVVITRRLSRSGESDYFLNGAACRLRDIHDMVRGTGLGADSGVVIEARMIDALLSDRPDDRREPCELLVPALEPRRCRQCCSHRAQMEPLTSRQPAPAERDTPPRRAVPDPRPTRWSAPLPRIARTFASGAARSFVATADTAAVRISVINRPSITASGVPVSGSTRKIVAICVGRPRSAFVA